MRILRAGLSSAVFFSFISAVYSQTDNTDYPEKISNNLPYSALVLPQKNDSRLNFSTLDTCATYTYRVKIGNNGREEVVHQITTGYGGNVLLTGKVRDAGNPYDALLMKLNPDGSVIWSKRFGDPGNNEEFNEARITRDGGIIAIGTSYPEPTGDGWIVICKMDNAGNQQWTKQFKTPAAGTIARGIDIVQMSDDNYLFVGDNTQSVLFGKLNPTGTLLWNKIASPFQTVKALRILEDYNGHFVTVTGTESGFNVASIFKINLSDGSFVWNRKFGGPAVNSHYIFHSVEMINLRPRITGIYAPVNQPYKFIRVNVNTGSLIEKIEEYSLAGAAPDVTAMSGQVATSQALIFLKNNTANEMTLIRNSIDQGVSWSKNYTHTGVFTLAAMDKTFDAGFLIACNENNDIYLFKTDSVGQNPGCNNGATITGMSEVFSPSIPNPSFPIINSIWQENNIALVSASIILDTMYSCKQLTCPPRPTEDSCLASFFKTYRSYEYAEGTNGISETQDNNLILTGWGRTDGYDPVTTLGITMKISKKGDLLQKQRWGIGSQNSFMKQIKLTDGNFLVAGVASVNGVSAATLTKFDQNLNIIWNKIYHVNIVNPWDFFELCESSDNEIFLALHYKDFPNLADRICINKLDNTGNLIWQKTYRMGASVSIFGNGRNLQVSGGFIYFNTLTHINNKWISLIVKIDKTTGVLVWAKTYTHVSSNDFRMSEMMRVRNNKIYLSGTMDYLPGEYDPFLVRLDTSGTFEKMSVHRLLNYTYRYRFNLTANGNIIFSDYIYSYAVSPPQRDNYFVKLDSNFNFINSKKSTDFGHLFTYAVLESSEGDIFATGVKYPDDPYNLEFFLKRHLPDGSLGACATDTLAIPTIDAALNVTTIPFIQADVTVLVPLAPIITVTPFSLQQSQLFCGSASGCDTVWLQGSQQVCDSVNQYQFRAFRNSGCNGAVSWNLSGAPVQIINTTDTTITVRFLGNGSVKIKSSLYSGCRWLKDSITITVLIAPSSLNLGPDLQLCPNNTIVLNAHTGYQNYLWQDGSTDSVFTITTPGLFWVETKDACNNTFRDSVTVTAAPPVPLDLGPDIVKCNNDSVTIIAPGGFMNYIWSPPYNITALSGQSVIVFPAIDTFYAVQAEKTPGCFAFDTIRVYVNHSPTINLGNDTSFCMGNSVILDAGTGFLNYSWSSGQSSQTISVFSIGLYSVQAVAVNNCISKDTFRVVNVYTNPVINLGPDKNVCNGTSLILDAGPSYTNYLWNNGLTSQTISVNNTGTWSVEVTDIHTCKGKDTIHTTLIETPSNFLLPDTALCAYSTIVLKSLVNFPNYLWNTGSIAPTITIANPGIYWLQVQSVNGCTGKDTIIVNPKQCMEGFYIPNAFTPNNNGYNDIFRPQLFGRVIFYKFQIYDRWGNLIYVTDQIQQGWDGKLRGSTKDTDVFVWTCSFQFEGKHLEFRKGTFTLIR